MDLWEMEILLLYFKLRRLLLTADRPVSVPVVLGLSVSDASL